MKKLLLIGMLISACTLGAYAQYTNDALRFSSFQNGGTARFKAMGNATTATGGDLSALGSNPAGLGFFTKSEFTLTPEFGSFKEKANYLNNSSKASVNKSNLNQAGIVFNTTMLKRKGADLNKGLISLNYGFGYQRTNDFHLESNFGGLNNRTSMADYFAELAGSTSPNSLGSKSLERYAYDNYLISYDDAGRYYYPETYADATNGNNQQRMESRIGGQSEATFALGGNISNQFYFGVSLNVVTLKYESIAQYQETGKAREYIDDAPSGNIMNYNFLFNQQQTTKGNGVSAKFGFIYKASDELRLGINLQTPTWLTIEDFYSETLDNRATSGGYSNTSIYEFRYNVATPFKASLGANYILDGQALITADIDLVDYSSIRFSSLEGQSSQVLSDNNFAVKQDFQQALNYRVGFEYKLNPLSLRAGYGLNGSPYKNDADEKYKTETYSAGLGIRGRGYYLDLAYVRQQGQSDFSPYTLSNNNQPVAMLKNIRNNVFLTLGLRF